MKNMTGNSSAPTLHSSPRLPRHGAQFVTMVILGCLTVLPMTQSATPSPERSISNENTAEGYGALSHLTSGSANTAIGYQALFRDTSGSQNTASGDGALYKNVTGFANTASGYEALNTNA